MLSERDRQVLDSMEADLYSADRRFVAGMRSGRPRVPREYRRTWSIVLLVLSLLAFGLVLFTGHPLAVVALMAVAVVGLVRVVCRRLDSA
jgi:Flp pilus assembly protein TadB